MQKDYYAVLSLPRNATADEIRARFRTLARTRHPDRFRGAEKAAAEVEFQGVTEAFNILSDPERRRLHDLELLRPTAAGAREAEGRGEVARVYLQRGIKAYRDGNYLEAASHFDHVTKTEPGNAQAWHHLALACSQQRRFLSRAMSAIERACELEPMNVSYLKLGGKLFAAGGLTSRAEQYYNDALTWGGEDPAVRQALEELGRPAKRGRPGFFGKVGG
jgi:curved DNA-binding protein CbpA